MNKVIECSGENVKIIKKISKDKAFVYLDPPYYPVSKTKDGKISPYKLYNGTDWIPVDFLKLKIRCDDLTKEGIPFMLSNSDCEFIRVLFKDYIIIDIDEARGMKASDEKGNRSKEKCLIITNFKQKEDFMKALEGASNLMGDQSK